jgi:chromosome segregation ATPase
MKHRLYLTLFLLLLWVCPVAPYAQETPTAQQSVENLRSQLRDIEAKQATLLARLSQIDEDLRPENIERSLALTGSTRPEELRAKRRQQLEKEKASVQAQLDQLTVSRSRLQAALTTAETAAYQQGAGTNSPPSEVQPGAAGIQSTRSAQPPPSPRSIRRRSRRARVKRRSQ